MISGSLSLVLSVGISVIGIATLALALFLIPKRIRAKRMQRLATKYNLDYIRKRQIPSSHYYKENILSGFVKGTRVEIFDSIEMYGFPVSSTHSSTHIIFDGIWVNPPRSFVEKLFKRRMRVSRIVTRLELLSGR